MFRAWKALAAGLLAVGIAGCSSAAPTASSGGAASGAPTTTAPSAAASAPAAAGGQKAASGTPFKIGFILPLSGPVASYGEGVRYAPVLQTQKVNAAGGINGSPVQVVTCDSPNSPNQAITCMRQLVNNDKVVAVVGPYYTGEMQAVVPLLKDLKVPVIAYTPAASYPGLVEKSDWAVLAGTDENSTVGMAVDAYKKVYPNVKKMVVVGDTQTAVTALTIKQVWPKVLPAKGFDVADTITFQFGTTDFAPIVTRIKASGAQGVALSALSPAGPNLMREMERQGLKLPVVMSSHLQTVPPLPQILGATANGSIQTMFFSPSLLSKPSVKQWVTEYQDAATAGKSNAKKPEVGYANEVQAYDAFGITIQSIKDAGVTPTTPIADARDKVRQAMHKIKDYPGVLQPKQVTADGHVTWDQWPLIAKDGAYQDIPQ